MEPGDPTTVVRAVYQLARPDDDFTVLMYVEQTGLEATLGGVVTNGWNKGSFVRGTYTEIQHEHDGPTTDAWQGSVSFVDSSSDAPINADVLASALRKSPGTTVSDSPLAVRRVGERRPPGPPEPKEQSCLSTSCTSTSSGWATTPRSGSAGADHSPWRSRKR
jgi:hypothetical protein